MFEYQLDVGLGKDSIIDYVEVGVPISRKREKLGRADKGPL